MATAAAGWSMATATSPIFTLRATFLEDVIASVEEIITRSDVHDPRRILHSIYDLRHAMRFFAMSGSGALARSQRLMETTMKHLQTEFHRILSSDESDCAPVPAAVTDDHLRSIAECMISSGYARECARVYWTCRQAVVDDGLRRLGFELLGDSEGQTLKQESADKSMRKWVEAFPVAVRKLFSRERALCDFVFGSSDSIKESCFSEITRDAALQLLAFPELAVLEKPERSSPETMITLFLDMYMVLSDLWPDIVQVFSYESTSAVRSQAFSTILLISEYVKSAWSDFVAEVENDASNAKIRGGGIHPLTRRVMNCLASLADYGIDLADVFADYPLPSPTLLRRPSFGFSTALAPISPTSTSEEEDAAAIDVPASVSALLAWLVMVLLHKMDSKAEIYEDASVSYLFLANNLKYVVTVVRGTNLSVLLGRGWVSNHEYKARSLAEIFQRLAWNKVVNAAVQLPVGMQGGVDVLVGDRMRHFNKVFDEVCKKQAGLVVEDGRMREELKASIAGKVVGPYRAFYDRCNGDGDPVAGSCWLSPEEIENGLMGLYAETCDSSELVYY